MNFPKIILILTSALLPAFSSPLEAPTAEPKPPLEIGYNEGWFLSRYGRDLTTEFDPELTMNTLKGIRQAGGTIVRLWLFEHLQGIELSPSLPQSQTVSPRLLDHLSVVLRQARSLGMRIYVTLFNGNDVQFAKERDDRAMQDYFWNLLNNKDGELDAFNVRVLAPLLQSLEPFQDAVYALDLMNEIEAPMFHFYWTVPPAGARRWMATEANFVHATAPWLKVTSSAGWDTAALEIWLGLFSGLGLDFYDLHVYADDANFFGTQGVCRRARADGVPIILGEFGQKSQIQDDDLQLRTTKGFLKLANELCFSAALAWRYDAEEKWWAYARPDGSHRPATEAMREAAGKK